MFGTISFLFKFFEILFICIPMHHVHELFVKTRRGRQIPQLEFQATVSQHAGVFLKSSGLNR